MVEAIVFYVFATVLVTSAIAILGTSNIVRAAVWLLGALGAAAGLYLLLSATFLAVVQLILYAGGILVLFVFGIMLTSRHPKLQPVVSRFEIGSAICIAFVLFCSILAALWAQTWPTLSAAAPTNEIPTIKAIGRELLTTYLLPFELISLLLLAVLIGAAFLARPQKQRLPVNSR